MLSSVLSRRELLCFNGSQCVNDLMNITIRAKVAKQWVLMRARNIVIVLFCSLALSGCTITRTMYQQDADLIRLEHLEYWTALLDEYHQRKGHYPLQKRLQERADIGLVKIATPQQLSYLSPGSLDYDERLDNNINNRFIEFSMADFVSTLESGLGRVVLEKYDAQRVPTSSPVGYNYFVNTDGYLFWTTCITCGVTDISTLLFDGYTPTVNIVSEGMKGKVTKGFERAELLAHPTYKSWKARTFRKEGYMRALVKSNEAATKQKSLFDLGDS